jgi:glutaredoxin 3
MESKIIIYSTQNCPYCVRAKNLFKSHGLTFKEIDLTGNSTELEKLKNKTNHFTVPQIFINDVFVGGYTDLVEKIQSGLIKL